MLFFFTGYDAASKSSVTWNNKGGVGKTTLTFHIATHYALTRPPLALSPETVLVIDLSPQENVSMAGNGKRERGKRKAERGKRKEESGKRKAERGKWKAERGKRKAERGKRKEERGKRKAERGKMKEQAEKSFKCHKTSFRSLSPA